MPRALVRRLVAGTATALLAVNSVGAMPVLAKNGPGPSQATCQLANGVKHVIYIQFDNTHLTRDATGVYSDLEQMPHLLNFIKSNGTILSKSYTVLISHTTGGMVSSLTGLYPDRNGITESNSYDYYQPNGVPTFTSAFKYWTAPVSATDSKPNMVTTGGKNTPAPWVTYTRDGCDVGEVSTANTVLENANSQQYVAKTDLFAAAHAGDTQIDPFSKSGFAAGQQITIDQGANRETDTITGFSGFFIKLATPLQFNHPAGTTVWTGASTDPSGDLTTTYGANSPQWQEGVDSQEAPFGSAAANKAFTDFVGIDVHCGQQSTSICASDQNAVADKLPDEPGGYNGYKALFGAKYVDPAINDGSASVNDTNGNPITDSFGQPGFPGFDSMVASSSLGYTATMQEAGVPITYTYISDAHDNHSGAGAFGPGEKGYHDQLASYDAAFQKFFDRLAADGINKSNSLFVFTADENDHFAGQQPNAAPFNEGCDGVNVYCTYNTAKGIGTAQQHGAFDVTNHGATPFVAPSPWPPAAANGPLVGEAGYNMDWSQLFGSSVDGTGFDISFDSAPAFYIDNQPQAIDSSGNPVLNSTVRDFESKAVGLNAFDPYVDSTQLTPVGRYFVDGPTLQALHMLNADPLRNMSFTMFSQPDYYFQTFTPCPGTSQGCVNSAFAWIHGDYSNDIGQTWLGFVGPGISNGGQDDSTWTDHVDIVPTVDDILGLTPDYQPDGRVITQVLTPSVAKGSNSASFEQLGAMLKQLDAPYGDFSHSLIVASTRGIEAVNAAYQSVEQQIAQLAGQRDALVGQIQAVLNGSSNGHREQLIQDAQTLLDQAAQLANP